MLRLLTAAIASPLLLAVLFLSPAWGWFAFLLAGVVLAAIELVRMMRSHLPGSPLAVLPVLVTLFALLLFAALSGDLGAGPAEGTSLTVLALLGATLLATVGTALVILFGRTPMAEVLPSLGLLTFATPYLALPVIALTELQKVDPWLVVLVLAVVWLGDTAAYYVGRRIGRHKMAPVVSPNKSWEGAAASLAMALVTAVVWCFIVPGTLDWRVFLIAVVGNTMGQIGDLFESLLKRSVDVKDSGSLLPGHGGMFDRIDALLLAAPVCWFVVLVLGAEAFAR